MQRARQAQKLVQNDLSEGRHRWRWVLLGSGVGLGAGFLPTGRCVWLEPLQRQGGSAQGFLSAPPEVRQEGKRRGRARKLSAIKRQKCNHSLYLSIDFSFCSMIVRFRIMIFIATEA